ncbi:hypothetical protein WR25_04007 [Diploscapter pachys]|uniref:CCHC-type domain-containing protein n=1 Tax=Diploscapter pachys TaxID=2018661 RepID=A0A2A2JB23_9BILA|nr:hypothetical protein WR25_04007 [Diploscapter pachys]
MEFIASLLDSLTATAVDDFDEFADAEDGQKTPTSERVRQIDAEPDEESGTSGSESESESESETETEPDTADEEDSVSSTPESSDDRGEERLFVKAKDAHSKSEAEIKKDQRLSVEDAEDEDVFNEPEGFNSDLEGEVIEQNSSVSSPSSMSTCIFSSASRKLSEEQAAPSTARSLSRSFVKVCNNCGKAGHLSMDCVELDEKWTPPKEQDSTTQQHNDMSKPTLMVNQLSQTMPKEALAGFQRLAQMTQKQQIRQVPTGMPLVIQYYSDGHAQYMNISLKDSNAAIVK